jgi:hypothetical protein
VVDHILFSKGDEGPFIQFRELGMGIGWMRYAKIAQRRHLNQ